MTMQQPVPQDFGPIWGALTQKQREQVLDDAADEVAEMFETMYRTLVEQAGFARPRPPVRLQMYRMREPVRWTLLRALDPREYVKQMRDWQQLEEKELNRPPAPQRSVTPPRRQQAYAA